MGFDGSRNSVFRRAPIQGQSRIFRKAVQHFARSRMQRKFTCFGQIYLPREPLRQWNPKEPQQHHDRKCPDLIWPQ